MIFPPTLMRTNLSRKSSPDPVVVVQGFHHIRCWYSGRFHVEVGRMTSQLVRSVMVVRSFAKNRAPKASLLCVVGDPIIKVVLSSPQREKGKPSARNECVVLEASAADDRPSARKKMGYHPEKPLYAAEKRRRKSLSTREESVKSQENVDSSPPGPFCRALMHCCEFLLL